VQLADNPIKCDNTVFVNKVLDITSKQGITKPKGKNEIVITDDYVDYTVTPCELPLSLVLSMQSTELFKTVIKEQAEEAKAVPINKKGVYVTSDYAEVKFFKAVSADENVEKRNVKLEDALAKTANRNLSSALGRSNQPVVFLDTTGRSYSLPAHTLPSARGQGEPLTGRLNPPPNAQFFGVLFGESEQKFLLASDAGYGFVVKLEELYAKNKAGKAMISLPKGSRPLLPRLVTNQETDLIAAVTNTGHLLIFPLKELPELTKGKGNKILSIPGSRVAAREEFIIDLVVTGSNDILVVKAGNKQLKLKPQDWKHYIGERGRRGNKLPRAVQKVDSLMVVPE